MSPVPLYIILNHVLNKIRNSVLIQQATNKQASSMTVFYGVLFGAKKDSAIGLGGSIFLYALDKIWGTLARNNTVLFDSSPTPEHPYLPRTASNPSSAPFDSPALETETRLSTDLPGLTDIKDRTLL